MLNESLTTIRTFHRISQAELATAMDVSKSYVSELESGKKKVTMNIIEKYSNHFKIPASSILLLSEAMGETNEGQVRLPRAAKKIGSIIKWIGTDT